MYDKDKASFKRVYHHKKIIFIFNPMQPFNQAFHLTYK